MDMDELILSLLIPIVSGFVILTKTPIFKYHYKNTTYNKLIIDSALCGLLLLLISFVIIRSSNLLFPFLPDCIKSTLDLFYDFGLQFCQETKLNQIPHNSYSLTTTLIVLVVLGYFYFWKKLTPTYHSFETNCRLNAKPNPLENLVLHSFKNFTPLMINLKNRKVYIGLVADITAATNLDELCFFTILPIASGVRDPENLSFSLQHSYDWPELSSKLEYSKEEEQDLKKALKVSMVINVDEVVSATVWLPSIYEHFVEKPKKPRKRPKSKSKK